VHEEILLWLDYGLIHWTGHVLVYLHDADPWIVVLVFASRVQPCVMIVQF
jgi:hypothetical protein